MKIVTVLVLAGLFLFPACRSGPGVVHRDPFYEDPPAAPREASVEMMAVEGANVREQLVQSNLVFTGEVLQVGKPSGVGSGVVVATQAVAYRVTAVLKGTAAPGDRIVVHHVIAGGATTDPVVHIRLNPAIWREGARLLVWASGEPAGEQYPGQTRYLNLWESPGPVKSEGHAGTRVRLMLR